MGAERRRFGATATAMEKLLELICVLHMQEEYDGLLGIDSMALWFAQVVSNTWEWWNM